MDSTEVQDLMSELQSVSLDMDDEQLKNAYKFCAVLEDLCTERCRAVVRAANKGPLLQVFMSDGWSVDMRSRTAAAHDGVRVDRRGRMRTEFVLQRAVLKCQRGDQWHIGVKIQRPRPLASKKCDDIFSAACDFCPVLALSGHRGVSIHVYLQDGLFAKPFGRRMIARHSMFWQPHVCPIHFDSDGDRMLCALKDWVYASKCYMHSCSNALKWGMRQFVVGGDELLESIHIAVSALLRASHGLFLVIPEFIATYVAFDSPDPDSPEDVHWLWLSLEVPPQLLDLFVKVNPRWHGDRLHCSSRLSGDLDGISAVTTLLHCCLHWVDFSETRWTKVGMCGRYFVRSLLMGVDRLVYLAMRHDAVCNWHLGGFVKRCSGPVRQYLAIAAFAARPSEGMLFELMQDDRFLLKHEACWQVVQDEHRYIQEAPAYLYGTISALLDVDCDWYRTSVLEGSLISVSYLHMECFGPLETAPLKYAVGDTMEKIKLLLVEEVSDQLALKWQSLAASGFEDELAAGIALFRESSFSTLMVEQAHGSGSQVMRRHPMLETASLTVRMTLHNCRMLFSHCPLERQFSRLQTLLDRTEQQVANVHHTGARQMYVKALLEEVNGQKLRGAQWGGGVRLSIFKHHSKHFDKLGQGQLAALRQRASVFNTKKIETLDDTRAHIVAQLGLLRERDAEEKRHGFLNHMTSIRFTPEQFTKFGEYWQQYGPDDIARVPTAPPAVPQQMQSLLSKEMEKAALPLEGAPDWLAYMVDYREAFARTAFFSDSSHPSGDVILKILLSIAQPRRVVFLECRRCRRGLSAMTAYGCYEYEAFRFVLPSQVPWTGSDDLWVVPEANAVSSSEVHTFGQPVAWSVFTRYLRKPGNSPQTSGSAAKGKTRLDEETLRLLQLEFPWLSLEELQAILKQHVHTPAPGGVGASGPSGSSSSSGQQRQQQEPEELPEDVVANVNEQLLAIRAEVSEATGNAASYFRLRALGGQWSVLQVKTLTTGFGSYAKDKSVALWCEKTRFPVQKTFAVKKFGMTNSRRLAEEVVRRGDYFFCGWVEAGSAVPFDFRPLAQAYRPHEDYSLWFDELDLASHSSQAAFALMELMPHPLLEEVDVPWVSRQR